MGKWLEAVRQKSEKGGEAGPSEPTKPPFDPFEGAPSGPFGDNEPDTPCPACNFGRWWQDESGRWWCERCTPFESCQWVRLLELPEGERPTPPPVTDEEVEAAVALAQRHGWDVEAFRAWCGDWSALPEPEVLEAMLAVIEPRPRLEGSNQTDPGCKRR